MFFYWIKYSQICVLPLTIALFAAWCSSVHKFIFFFTDSFNIFRVITFLPRDVEFVVKFTFLPLLVALLIVQYLVLFANFIFCHTSMNTFFYKFEFLPLAISLFAAWCLIMMFNCLQICIFIVYKFVLLLNKLFTDLRFCRWLLHCLPHDVPFFTILYLYFCHWRFQYFS